MKNALIFLGVGIMGVASYFAIRKREVKFYDNVRCKDHTCKEFDTKEKVDSYVSGGRPRQVITYEDGMLHLIFEKPHGLRKDEEILIEQSAGAKYPQYNGLTSVVRVPNDYVIAVVKPRLGDTPTNGGVVTAKSILSEYF